MQEFKEDQKKSSKKASGSSQIFRRVENFDLFSAEKTFCIVCVVFFKKVLLSRHVIENLFPVVS